MTERPSTIRESRVHGSGRVIVSNSGGSGAGGSGAQGPLWGSDTSPESNRRDAAPTDKSPRPHPARTASAPRTRRAVRADVGPQFGFGRRTHAATGAASSGGSRPRRPRPPDRRRPEACGAPGASHHPNDAVWRDPGLPEGRDHPRRHRDRRAHPLCVRPPLRLVGDFLGRSAGIDGLAGRRRQLDRRGLFVADGRSRPARSSAGNADAIELRGGLYDMTIGLVIDNRVLPDAPDCWVTAGEKAYIARVARSDGGGAAVYAQEKQNAEPTSEDQGGGVTLENPGYFGGDVSGFGDEAFCTGISPTIMARRRRPPGRCRRVCDGRAARGRRGRSRTWARRATSSRRPTCACWPRTSPGRCSSSEGASDQLREELVREEPAARCQDDPRVIGDRDQLGRERPAEPPLERRPRRPASGTPAASRRPRIAVSAAARPRPRSSAPPGGACGGAAIAWSQRRDIAVQPRGVPAAGRAVEGVGARPDGLVRRAPSTPGCGGSRGPAAPVGDLVPREPAAAADGPRARTRRGAVIVLLGPRALAPPPAPAESEVVAVPVSLRLRVVERQRVQRQVVGRESTRASSVARHDIDRPGTS